MLYQENNYGIILYSKADVLKAYIVIVYSQKYKYEYILYIPYRIGLCRLININPSIFLLTKERDREKKNRIFFL